MRFLYFVAVLFLPNILFSAPNKTLSAITLAYDSAIAQYIRTDNEQAISNFNNVISTGGKLSDAAVQRKIVKSYSFLGSIYTTQGKFTMALEQYYIGMGIAERIKDQNGKAQILLGIGDLYFYWHRLDDAMRYYIQSEKILKETGEEKLLADCYNHKGAVYEQQSHLSSALSCYSKALNIFEKLQHTNSMTAALMNMGNVYSSMGNFEKGIAYLNKALAIANQYQNKDNIAYCLVNLGIVYDSLHNYDTAEIYWNRGIDLAKETGSIEMQIVGYEAVARISARKKDFASAYKMTLLYDQLKDSLFNAQNVKQVQEINAKYETEKKERKISEQALIIQHQKTKVQLILLSLLVLAFILIFATVYYLQKSKSKQEKERFRAMLNAEQKERMRIARDLHDSLGQKLAVTRMQLSSITGNDAINAGSNIPQTQNLLDDAIQELRHISHNLIPEELNFGIVAALEEMCFKANTSGTIVFLQINDNLKLNDADKQFELSLYRITQEILNNILKHASASRIEIHLTQKEGEFLLEISDNGKGFDPAKIHDSTGLGWKNIFARISLLNGKINVHSAHLQGTQIKITLPEHETR
ncbi:MAG TPA: sensor histidine kinase [Flavipsychrobacter sp.]|nr:sensor histidine kinase [Flavipsychrobacter sp.]